jgi:hypothetical protein
MSRTQQWLILFAMTGAQAMTMLDKSVVSVTLPTLATDLALAPVDLQWVVNAYMLAMAAFVAVGGRLAEVYGEVPTFEAGIVVFVLASVGCAFAPAGAGGAWIIAFRAVQGLGAALMMPVSAAIVLNTFAAAEAGMAMAIYTGIAQVFQAMGPPLDAWSCNGRRSATGAICAQRFALRMSLDRPSPACQSRDFGRFHVGIRHPVCHAGVNPVRRLVSAGRASHEAIARWSCDATFYPFASDRRSDWGQMVRSRRHSKARSDRLCDSVGRLSGLGYGDAEDELLGHGGGHGVDRAGAGICTLAKQHGWHLARWCRRARRSLRIASDRSTAGHLLWCGGYRRSRAWSQSQWKPRSLQFGVRTRTRLGVWRYGAGRRNHTGLSYVAHTSSPAKAGRLVSMPTRG